MYSAVFGTSFLKGWAKARNGIEVFFVIPPAKAGGNFAGGNS